MNTVFDIEQKQDSPEKLAAAAGKPTANFLFATEFNMMTKTMKQLVIDTIELDLYWMEKQQRSILDTSSNIDPAPVIGKVNLLGVSIKNHDFFAPGIEVKLFIDRYRPKRNVEFHTDVRSAGYKHPENQSTDYPERLSEIVLKTFNSFVDFGQEFYFKIAGAVPRASGFGIKKTSRRLCQAVCHLQFRLQITIDGKIYNSKPLTKLNMVIQKESIKTPFVISYKRP
jgi:hypothetical protein